MNMWMGVPASQLCNRHLYGVHGELHKFLHNWRKRHKCDKRIELHQMEPMSYKARHDECAQEMLNRKGNHQSPLEQPDFSYLPQWQQEFVCDGRQKGVLIARCPECAKRMNGGI